MGKIIKGSKIKNNKLNTFHIVECVEIYENITLIYTEDIKCFPSSELELVTPLSEKLYNLFYIWINPKKEILPPDEETNDELERLLKSDYTVEMIKEDFDKMLKEIKSTSR